MANRLRVVVSGMICAQPHQGGATWAVLQYLLGLPRLGCQVHFVETLSTDAVRPAGSTLVASDNAAYLHATLTAFGLGSCWSLLARDSTDGAGVSRARLRQICRSADLLLDLSGGLRDEELLNIANLRVYVDLDPAFTQLWHAVEGIDMGFAGHDRFVTVGLGLGREECPVPTCGVDWITTLPPVVLEHWPPADEPAIPEVTTVSHWRGYGSVSHQGVFYGQKAHSMRRLIELPRLTEQPLLLALAIHPDERGDLAALDEAGWRIVDPQLVAATPATYRAFIRRSRGELGVAKSGYVESRCGWFSDRSACYLASGRPVVAQDTGFSDFLPTGAGLLAFGDAAEAAQALASVNRDYRHHAKSARRLALEYLDADVVLSRLLESLGGA